MPQRFYLDKEKLDEQLEKLNRNLNEMLEFAYLHEDMIITIEDLMSEWARENLSSFDDIKKEWDELSDEEREYYLDDEEFNIDQFIQESYGSNWFLETDKLSDDEKMKLIERYRVTISTCLFSDTYNYDTLKESINSHFEYYS